jgi:hypothetical protein
VDLLNFAGLVADFVRDEGASLLPDNISSLK